MDRIPENLNKREKGNWITAHWSEIQDSIDRVGKAETSRQIGIYVGSIYNRITRSKKPRTNPSRPVGRPRLTRQERNERLFKRKKVRTKKGASFSPLRAIDILSKASKGKNFNNSLVQAIVTILEDYSKTKTELKSREEQISLLLESLSKSQLELLRYKESSKIRKNENMNKVLERAKSSLITYGD